MPEVRVDPLSGLRTIVAADRASRPNAGLRATPPEPIDPETDPFLEGHEDRTPPEVDAFRADGSAPDTSWRAWLQSVVDDSASLRTHEGAPLGDQYEV